VVDGEDALGKVLGLGHAELHRANATKTQPKTSSCAQL
jgi:hypothetical protein